MKTTAYFATNSESSFDDVCTSLRASFNLPEFKTDRHDSWLHGSAGTNAIWFNVTRADDSSTVETWMESCPPGVNFQIIAKFETEPDDLTSALANALESELFLYQSNTA